MPTTPYNSSHLESTLEPADHPDKLTAWWARLLPNEMEIPVFYHPYKVRVIRRVKEESLDRLFFELVHDQEKKERNVEMFDISSVWPDLPSTAQLVIPGQTPTYAFLFLSPEWAKDNLIKPEEYAEKPPPPKVSPYGGPSGGGGKFPSSGGAKNNALLSLIRQVQEEGLRNKLLSAVRDFNQTTSHGMTSDE